MATVTQSPIPSPYPRVTRPTGLWRWVTTVDHKDIAMLYFMGALVFLVIGGLEALLIRIQLAQPREAVVSASTYAVLFTMHGTTMIFLVAMPLLAGFANFVVPLQIGARDMVFPRLNALSVWLFFLGGLSLYFSFIAGGAPDQMWFMYAPLTERPFSFGPGAEYWSVGIFLASMGSIATALNMIVTVTFLRAPGLTFTRIPMFTWTVVVQSLMILYALPILGAGQIMLLFDNTIGTHFFQPQFGADVVLWEHIFWSFGHPEVYIVILPAFGMISETIPVFARKPLFGFTFVAGSTVAIGFLSFLVWAHHMFTSGLGLAANAVFSATSVAIAVPTGVKIFNWLGTIWKGSIQFTTAMLFAVALISNFVIGGLTGPMLAVPPVDQQLHDSYFIVAHMHYVLFGGVIFGALSGLYYWFPKMTGRLMAEGIGKISFWLTVIGMNVTFFPQHFLGLDGMPRHFFTYPADSGWGPLNLLSTIGSFVMAIGLALLVWNIIYSFRRGDVAGSDPWDGYTLEWATTSPPPPYNFVEIPEVHSRRPWLDYKQAAQQAGEALG
jgi:cytochrome c oxidase subunit I